MSRTPHNYWTNGGLIKTCSILFLFITGLSSGIICAIEIIKTGSITSTIAAGAFMSILALASHSLGVQVGTSSVSVLPIVPVAPLLQAVPVDASSTSVSPRSGH